MMRRTTTLVFLFALAAAGCSDDGSSQPLDGSAHEGIRQDGQVPQPDTTVPPDSGSDRGVDTTPAPDGRVDSRVDSGADGRVDSGTDSTVDSGTDTTVDSGPDTTVDGGASNASLSGTISQTDGETTGTEVIVRLYDSNAPEDIASPIAEVTLTATDGVLLPATAFQFTGLAAGTYYLRAYRDAGGPVGPPDGRPTLATDPQAPAQEAVITTGDVTGVTLALHARTGFDDAYGGYDARTVNVSADATPPTTFSVTNQWLVGGGVCGGFYLRLNAQLEGSASGVSAPYVMLPDGNVVTLLDDGGCSAAVNNNTSSSYDEGPADGQYTYGIRSPQAAAAGDYLFFYRQAADDFIHEEVDNIATIVKLPLLRELTSPNGTTSVATLTPTLTWSSVPGAVTYEVTLFNRDGTYDNYDDDARAVQTAAYTPTVALVDDSCYQLQITASDQAEADADIDAYSAGSDNFFCTDVDGFDTITLSGALNNHSNKNATTVIDVYSREDELRMSRVRVAANATTYQVAVLVGDSNEGGRVSAFVDAAQSGVETSVGNASRRSAAQLDLTAIGGTVSLDLTLNPEVELVAPARWARVSSRTPTFSWNDYATTAGSNAPADPFMLAFYVSSQVAGGLPESIWILPPDATSFDFASPPAPTAAFDVIGYANCRNSGGTYSVAANGTPSCSVGSVTPSNTQLVPNAAHVWGVLVFDCPFTLYTPGGDNTDFFDCVNTALDLVDINYGRSEERVLVTPQ